MTMVVVGVVVIGGEEIKDGGCFSGDLGGGMEERKEQWWWIG